MAAALKHRCKLGDSNPLNKKTLRLHMTHAGDLFFIQNSKFCRKVCDYAKN